MTWVESPAKTSWLESSRVLGITIMPSWKFCRTWLEETRYKPWLESLHQCWGTWLESGADPGGQLGRSPPLKPKKTSLFTMILYNSQNIIRVLRPFCPSLFCHSNVVKYTSSLSQWLTRNKTWLLNITETASPKLYWLDPPLSRVDVLKSVSNHATTGYNKLYWTTDISSIWNLWRYVFSEING